ncbi:hypothetical protein SAMN05192583_2876 [Sphingomonas gellani]|uniref:Hemerythrin HHE cation binding domain-containing protein n=1 Tax=Sphingomonas gellani TaxID=1166340 RepID=A0A1H8GTK3_9SPHN|nr:hypothetical protein [Sphingomonas gellani]SEN46817.1 hypothetical protein SAMN05192583_2876 [Sphingomonas gellani]
MQHSYRQLISEHEQIEECANALLADVADASVPASDLAAQLGELALVVKRHIAVEDEVVGTLDPATLSQPWTDAWVEGEAAFKRLKSDWMAFLVRWDGIAIAEDRSGFVSAAQAILGRLRDRLAIETRAFYATALQTGSIALR